MWFKLIALIWGLSVLISIGLINIFNSFLKHLPIFSLPEKIYHFERLRIDWTMYELVLVSTASLLILFVISWRILSSMEKDSILKGLREEFN